MIATGRALLAMIAFALAAPAVAQRAPAPSDKDTAPHGEERRQQQPDPRAPQLAPVEAGRTAESAVGRAGQRQTRDKAAPGISPMSRVTNRINNRVESRIRNRIDQNYDPQANATSPFEVAGDQARTAVTRTR